MSGFFGADTDQLRDHARLVSQRAQKLVELHETLEPLVMNESIWHGPDADAFRQSWTGDTARLFELRHDDLTQRGEDLQNHAEEQDTASGVGGGGSDGGDGSGDGGGGFNPLGFLKDLAIKGQGLYGKFKKFSAFMGRIPSAFGEFGALASRGLEGLWKSTYLDELFHSGNGWQKGAEKLLSKLGIPTNFLDKSPLKFLNKLDDVAPWLAKAGSGLGKALPFVDVALGVHKIATADNWYDRTSGILSTAGGALLIAAPFTGPAAPIVGAIGAGLGIVSLGMDAGKMIYENWDSITSTVSNVGSAISDGVSNVGSAVSDGIGNVGSAISDGVSDVGSAVSDGIGNVADAFGF